MDNPQHTTTETRAEGSADPSVLGDQLAGLAKGLTDFFAGLDPTTMSGEDLTAQMFPFLDAIKVLVQDGGEQAYVARRVGMFLAESLSAALRRGRSGEEVPHEHAAVLDAVYQKIQSAKSGVAGDDVSVEQLTNLAENAEEQMRGFFAQAGLLRKIPKTEGSDSKIVLSG